MIVASEAGSRVTRSGDFHRTGLISPLRVTRWAHRTAALSFSVAGGTPLSQLEHALENDPALATPLCITPNLRDRVVVGERVFSAARRSVLGGAADDRAPAGPAVLALRYGSAAPAATPDGPPARLPYRGEGTATN